MWILRLEKRLKKICKPQLLRSFLFYTLYHGTKSALFYKIGNRTLPPFLFISITNACNLKCKGCWVKQTQPPVHMRREVLESIIKQSMNYGNRLFGIMGGEPLLYPGLFDIFSAYRKCYFQLFTNGTLIDRLSASLMAELGNISPLINIEGINMTYGMVEKDVYDRTIAGIEYCVAEGLVVGGAVSVSKQNFNEVVAEDFIKDMIDKGFAYIWYYIYRPCGDEPTWELVLDKEEIVKLREFLVEVRSKYPIVIIDTYWDSRGRAFCPAVIGLSHHINHMGYIEPCPPVQFSDVSLDSDGKDSLKSLFKNSRWLLRFKEEAAKYNGGCILLEDPVKLRSVALEVGALDTSGRDNMVGFKSCPSHCIFEIKEKSIFYRLIKKVWFCGLGAYG